MAEKVKPVWGRGVPKPSTVAQAFVKAHPECKTDPDIAVFTSVYMFASYMLEVNPVPAMFREHNQAQKNLFKAMGLNDEERGEDLSELFKQA